MFSPQIWIALAIGFFAWGSTMFGVGYHYGEKNTVPTKTYEKVVEQLATDQATINEAKDKNDRDAKALAADAANGAKKSKADGTQITADERNTRKAIAARNPDATDLATTRRVLDAVSSENAIRAASATAGRNDNGATQSTDPAGRSDSCKSTLTAAIISSSVNGAELKRAIKDRDSCVDRYNTVRQRINGS